jgi:CP family cyanate transporter-like MFS transporter
MLAVVAVALVSVDLRPGATSLGPVLDETADALGLGATAAGVMTAVPGLCFALVGATAVALSRRVGVTPGIVLGLAAITVGLAVRCLVGSFPVFLALTVLALAGMAVGNVLVPAWIKQHSADGGVRLLTVYGTGVTAGGSLGSLLSAPLAEHAPGGWRAALGVWALLGAATLVPWVMIAVRARARPGEEPRPEPAGSGPGRVWRSRTSIALAVYFGIQAMNAYAQFGWLPQIYRDAGIPAVTAGGLTAWVAALGIGGGLTLPRVVARSADLSWMVWSLSALLVVGYLGIWLFPTGHDVLPWVWATLLGVSGWTFPAAIALITVRTRDPAVTARVSGFVQPSGYLLAAIGPFLVGIIHDVTHGWTGVLLFLMLSAVGMTVAGLLVARPRYVDDELEVRR